MSQSRPYLQFCGNRVEGFKSAAFKSKGGNVDITLPLIDVGVDGLALFEGVHTALHSVVTSDSEYHSVSTSDSGLMGGTDRTWNYGSRRDTAHKGHVIGHTIFRGQTAISQADHIGDFSDETTRGTRMEPTFVETSSHSYHDRSSWKGDASASASSRERTPIMPITSGGKFSNAKPEGVRAEPGAETVLRAAAYKESTLAHDVSVRGAEREAEAPRRRAGRDILNASSRRGAHRDAREDERNRKRLRHEEQEESDSISEASSSEEEISRRPSRKDDHHRSHRRTKAGDSSQRLSREELSMLRRLLNAQSREDSDDSHEDLEPRRKHSRRH